MITKKTIWNNLIILTMTLLIVRCSTSQSISEKETLFNARYPNIPMEGYLKLFEDPNLPKVGSTAVIVIENVADQVILLPEGFPHELLMFDEVEQKWSPVDERVNHSNIEKMFLYPEDDLEKAQFKIGAQYIEPDIEVLDKPVAVRVVVFGEIIENNQTTGKEVGAYLDITFQP